MGNFFALLYQELVKTLQKPRRLIHFLNKDKVSQFFGTLPIRLGVGETWSAYDGERFRKRVHSSYESYLVCQRNKLRHIDLAEYEIRYRSILRERLEKVKSDWQGKTVLCLAARLGTEVKAFLDMGCFAIGIDLNPGEDNRYVLYGDFHEIQFPSGSVDVVFTNSLDHAFDIEKLIVEIRRVLKTGGVLLVEAARGSEEGKAPGFYESFWWRRIDDLVGLFENSRFRVLMRCPFDYPWAGEQVCFEKEG